MFTALFWVFADYIGNTPARIIVKIIILGVFIMIELCVWINATLPWLVQFTTPSGLHSVLERPFSEANGRPFLVKRSPLIVC